MVERGELAAWRTGGGHRRITVDSVRAWVDARGVWVRGSNASAPAATPEPAQLRVLYAGVDDNLFERCASVFAPDPPTMNSHRVSDALDALLLAERWRPHVLIASANLPPIGAHALLGRLRAHPQFAQMLAVILTPGNGVIERLAQVRPPGCVCWPAAGAADRARGLIEGLLPSFGSRSVRTD